MTTISVSTLDELRDALNGAKGGETILLAGGEYAPAWLGGKDVNLDFPQTVTLTSADPSDPAVFSYFSLNGARNVTIDGIAFDYTYREGDAHSFRPFSFKHCENLVVRNSVFEGDDAWAANPWDNGYPFGVGLDVMGGRNLVFENNEISGFWKGIVQAGGQNVVISGNDLHGLRSDGINFFETSGISIEGNHIHDFRLAPDSWDHADMIQTWVRDGMRPSSDIVIKGNRLDIGEGGATQGIFMGNQAGNAPGADEEKTFYRNVLIEDNLMINGMAHGITLGESLGAVVRGNTVVQGGGKNAPATPLVGVAGASKNVVVENNITAKINATGTTDDWSVSGNVLVQRNDPNAPGHYDHIFIASTIHSHDFVPMEGVAPWAGVRVDIGGFDLSYHAVKEGPATIILDASFARLDGAAMPAGTKYVWTFGDGTTAEGLVVEHDYATSGPHSIVLTATLPDGRQQSAAIETSIASAQAFSYVAGNVASYDGFGLTQRISSGAMSDAGLILSGQKGSVLDIPGSPLAKLTGAQSFCLDIEAVFREGTGGALFRKGSELSSWMDTKGDLVVAVRDADGHRFTLQTKGADLDDGASHKISLRLQDGRLELLVDDVVHSGRDMTADLAVSNHAFNIGSPWADNAYATVTSASLTIDADRFPTEAGTRVLVESPPAPILPELELDPPGIEIPETNMPEPPVVDYWDTILSFNAETGFTSGGVSVDVAHVATHNGFSIDTKGLGAHIDRATASELVSGDGFHVGFTIEPDGQRDSGQLLNIAGANCKVYVKPDGELMTIVRTEQDGVVRLNSTGADMSRPGEREVDIVYVDQTLEIRVDGETVISSELPSPMSTMHSTGVYFGNPWGQDNFTGTVDNLEMRVLDDDLSFDDVMSAFEIRDDMTPAV